MTAFVRPLVVFCALTGPGNLAAATFDQIASGAVEGHAVRISDTNGNVIREYATDLVNTNSRAEASTEASYARASGNFSLGVRTGAGFVESVSSQAVSWSFTQEQIDAATNAGGSISLSLGFALSGTFSNVPPPSATPLGTTADLFVAFNDPVIANLAPTEYGPATGSGSVFNLPPGIAFTQSTDAPNSYGFLPDRFVPEGLGTVDMVNVIFNVGVELFAPQANTDYSFVLTRSLSADSSGIVNIDFANSLTLVDVDAFFGDGSEVQDFTDFTTSSGDNLFTIAATNASAASIPLPAGGWLLLTGVAGMMAMRRARTGPLDVA